MRPTCPECGRISRLESVVHGLDGSDTILLKCGHELKDLIFPVFKDWEDFHSLNGHTPYPFQIRSIDLALKAGMRFVCTHEMGLGKTIIAAMLMKRYKEQFGRTLIVCKASLTVQWFMEMFEWAGVMAQRIETSREPLHHNSFKVVIVSMDTLKLCDWRKDEVFRTVILDEVQNLKNANAARTQAAMDVASRADYVIGLSGTPVKNHMGEYFQILHAVRPDIFRSEAGFLHDHVATYNDGYGFKFGGASNIRRFREITKDFVFGFARKEVAPELPIIRRTFRFLELDKDVDRIYRERLARFRDAYFKKGETNEERFKIHTKQREEMMGLYHIVGMAKVKPTIEFVEEFLDEVENEKIVLFVEHIAVGDLLESGINKLLAQRHLDPCVRIRGGIDATESSQLEQCFKSGPRRRVLVASTRGCGEGKNFQFCSRAVMVERQWNAANEEQAEARFTRIGSVAETVDVTYMVARKTYDEQVAKLIEKKREIQHSAVGEDVVGWKKSDFMRELMDLMAREAA